MAFRLEILVVLLLATTCTATTTDWRANPAMKVQVAMSMSKRAAENALSNMVGRLQVESETSSVQNQALEDCIDLIESTSDLLTETINELSGAVSRNQTSLSWDEAMYYRTWASAALTNHDTCLDGLRESGLAGRNLPFTQSVTKSALLCGHALQFISDIPVRRKRSPNLWWQTTPKAEDDDEKTDWNNTAPRPNHNPPFNASKEVTVITVAQDGSGTFSRISDAIQAAPSKSATGAIIYVKKGLYCENIEVPKSKINILLMGEGMDVTIITGNRSVADKFNTFNTATFAVRGHGFMARDITFENTAGPEKGQAVALRVQAEQASFYRCSIKAYQDTLYVHTFTQYFRDCDIYGTVDFIFGNAAAVFQNCNIYPRRPMPGQFIAITAQGRNNPNQNTGIIFHNCNVTAARETTPLNQTADVFLGRPWRNYSRTIVMESFLDGLVNPLGWSEWNGEVPPRTIYYGEFNNTGPGAATKERVKWPSFHAMNNNDAENFTVSSFIHGEEWLPYASVPFDLGLKY